MADVLHMTKLLVARPAIPEHPGVAVRNYRGPDDIALWLEIRRQAFATESPAARPWTVHDFTAEVLDKPWWSPARMWLAENFQDGSSLGTVMLALRAGRDEVRPVVHWLAVVPRWRRLGLARLLMAHLEDYCWQQGYRQLDLETHVNWQAAVQLYHALGFTNT
ncbi:MAG: GNAT family N-acetyltransferase [Planctomycetota bacterium]|nr:GNAT family N-acetyltransferase [Planctomycetota bacterium]